MQRGISIWRALGSSEEASLRKPSLSARGPFPHSRCPPTEADLQHSDLLGGPGTVAQEPPLLEASVPLVGPCPGKPLSNHRSNVAGEPGPSLGFFKQCLTLKDQKESAGRPHNKWPRIPSGPSSESCGCERPSQNPRRMEIG